MAENTTMASPGGHSGVELADPIMLVQHLKGFQIALAALYSVAFIGGASGNFYVINVVTYVLRTLHGPSSNRQTRHVLVYILSLSLVDLSVLMTIPFVVTDLILTTWIFGSVACKMYVVLENLNKWLSILILCALAADRFLAIKFPIKSYRFRKPRVAAYVVLTCFIIVAVVMLPLPFWTHLKVIPYNASFLPDHDILYIVRIIRCTFRPPDHLHPAFIAGSFTFCYCVPAIAILIFYSGILHALYDHQRTGVTSVPIRRVLLYILLATGFYFLCWSPYWLFAVLFQLIFDMPSDVTVITVWSYLCLLLPYVNSAINPILYALLNRELRQSHLLAISQKSRRKVKYGPVRSTGSNTKTSSSSNNHSKSSIQNFVHIPPVLQFLPTRKLGIINRARCNHRNPMESNQVKSSNDYHSVHEPLSARHDNQHDKGTTNDAAISCNVRQNEDIVAAKG